MLNKNKLTIDFMIFFVISILSFYFSFLSSFLILIYFIYRIFTSKEEETLYLILLFSANPNVYFLFGIPVCNIIIILSLLRLCIRRNIKNNLLFKFCCVLCLFEVLHWIVYDFFNIAQSIVWCGTIFYITIYFSNCKEKYDNKMAIKYFITSVILSTLYGCFYRIYSNQGFSVLSFNINDNARFGGGFYDPNYFSFVCLLVFAFLIDCIYQNSRNNFSVLLNCKIMLILSVLFFFCIATLSKMFLIVFSMLVLLLIPLLTNFSKESKRLFIVLFFTILSFTFAFKIMDFDVYSIFQSTIRRFQNVSSLNEFTTGRSDLIETAIYYLNSNFFSLIFGIGVQTYGNRLGTGYLHCFPMEIITTLGIIGSIIYILYFVIMCKSLTNNFKKTANSKILKCLKFIPLIISVVCSFALNVIEIEIFYPLTLMLFLNFFYIE